MHCHTKEGSIDAKVPIQEYITKLVKEGFDGMLVTDHNSYDGYRKFEKIAKNLHLEKPFTVATFIHHLRDHQKSLGIIYDDKCIGTNGGFHNVDLNPFVPVDTPCPWD